MFLRFLRHHPEIGRSGTAEVNEDGIPGPSFRLKFLPVQENLPEPGFVLKNSLRAEIIFRAEWQMLQITCKAPKLQICSFETMFDTSIRARIGVIRA